MLVVVRRRQLAARERRHGAPARRRPPRAAAPASSPQRLLQPRARHPPRLADRLLAARHPHRAQVPGALEAGQVARRAARRPTRRRRARSRCRRRSRRPPGPPRRARPGTAARCAWWCWTATWRDALALERVLGREVLRVQVVGDHLGRDRRTARSKCATPSRERAASVSALSQVADVVGDPRARVPREAERATSARRRRRGAAPPRATGSGRLAGTWPRERRSSIGRPSGDPRPPSRRCGCGSAGRGAGYSSAIPASRSCASPSSNAIGSSETLPAVITSGTPSVGEQQVVQRRVGEHQPELARARGDGRRDRRAVPPRREHDRPLARAQQRAPRRPARRAPRRGRDVAGPSARTASPRGACARAAPPPPARRRPRRRGGSRRGP